MADRITLKGLRARGRHGVLPAERAEGQDFLVDVALDLDLSAAAKDDDLTKTVDYGVLAGRLVQVITGEPVDLIETLADRLVEVCLEDERVQTATVTVHKPHAPIPHEFADVAVRLRRGRAER
ncbi:dihydroneopterin aldolase [Asanoa sp. NPDC049573]|uniref:dihydroneopterin aldolase n=1 Tax=Asanoa sp. NPDC049573 TaxID=3155396 RepID=UPI003448364B